MSLKNQIQISNLLDTLKQYIDITTLNLNNPKPSSLADFIKRDFTRDINFEELNFIDFELEKKTETSEAIEEKVQMLYNYQKYSYYDIPFDNLKIFDDYLRIAQIFLKPLNPSDVSFLYDVNQHLHKKKIEEIFMQDDVKESFINSFGGQKLENNPALNFVIDSFQDFKTQLNKVEDLPVTTTSSLLEKESKFD